MAQRSKAGTRVYRFKQAVPIPSYLLALAVGNLESRELGPISAVWSEPEMVEAGAYEFAGGVQPCGVVGYESGQGKRGWRRLGGFQVTYGLGMLTTAPLRVVLLAPQRPPSSWMLPSSWLGRTSGGGTTCCCCRPPSLMAAWRTRECWCGGEMRWWAARVPPAGMVLQLAWPAQPLVPSQFLAGSLVDLPMCACCPPWQVPHVCDGEMPRHPATGWLLPWAGFVMKLAGSTRLPSLVCVSWLLRRQPCLLHSPCAVRCAADAAGGRPLTGQCGRPRDCTQLDRRVRPRGLGLCVCG